MFAKHCEYTYANDFSEEKIRIAKNNLHVYQGHHMNVQFMCSDFLTMRKEDFKVSR